MEDFYEHSKTSYLPDVSNEKMTLSEGAGVGFCVRDGRFPQVERNRGIKRFYTVFNPTPVYRREPVEIVVWEWEGNFDAAVFKDLNGNVLKHQFLANEQKYFWNDHYWFFKYRQALVELELPPYSYVSCILDEAPCKNVPIWTAQLQNMEPANPVLDNGKIRAAFDMKTGGVKSLINLETGEEYISEGKYAGIMGIDELGNGTAWVLGNYVDYHELKNICLTQSNMDKDALRQWVRFSGIWRNSPIEFTVSLDKGSSLLDWQIKCQCREIGITEEVLPQLTFKVPLNFKCNKYWADTQFGVVSREERNDDIPARFIASAAENKKPLVLWIENGYACRGYKDTLSATLLRCTADPDTAPEVGERSFKLRLGFVGDTKTDLARAINITNIVPPVVSATRHEGYIPPNGSLLSHHGDGVLTSVKPTCDESGEFTATIFETEGNNGIAKLDWNVNIEKAWITDSCENKLCEIKVKNNMISIPLEPYKVKFVRVKARLN